MWDSSEADTPHHQCPSALKDRASVLTPPLISQGEALLKAGGKASFPLLSAKRSVESRRLLWETLCISRMLTPPPKDSPANFRMSPPNFIISANKEKEKRSYRDAFFQEPQEEPLSP